MSETTQQAVSEGGAYEILKSRLFQQGKQLKTLSQTFNQNRQAIFGGRESQLVGKANVQTEARSIPIDMAQVNQQLLFGYQVHLGLKAAPSLQDVFGLYQLHEQDGTFRIEPLPLENSFLTDPRFLHEFTELFTYYSDAKLTQISRQESVLYIVFQIGMRVEDRKVFRFQLNANSVEYLDALGNQHLESVQQHDVQWITTTREDHVLGTHPHVSIRDKLFVECVGGDLTIKIEDNTDDGKGIYREEVEDPHQSVADALIEYAFIGDLIALKIKPNREKDSRYFIYNPINQTVTRADALRHSIKALPEDHGVLFSHGYVLANGESKLFDMPWQHLKFFQKIASPNGEDLIYFFFNMLDGHYVGFTYNMIEKQFAAPLESHGFSLYPDGRMLVFQLSENAEASTIHPLRIWDTPFSTPEHYAAQNASADGSSPLFNLGNAELVRALSSVLSICQLAQTEDVTQAAFEVLLKECQSTLDHYHWLNHGYALGMGEVINSLMDTANKIIDEFAKVLQMQKHATESLGEHQQAVRDLIAKIKLAPKEQANVLLSLLSDVKAQVGTTMALRQQHYMDAASVDTMLETLQTNREQLNHQLLALLQEEKAYQPFKQQIQDIEAALVDVSKTADIQELQAQVDTLRADLQLVTEEVTEIETDDPTQSTRILDMTTEVSSLLNAVSARLRNKTQSLQSHEAQAEFSAQFKLLGQSVSSAMEQADTPDECDTQLAKLVGQLDKLESRFADFDQFLAEIYAKRDEIQSTLDNHKQQLIAAQQRRVQNLLQAANVTMSSIEKRVSRFDEVSSLNSYFATDAMVLKLHQLSQSIRDLGDSVKADSLDARMKSLQDQSLRALRDNQDIFEDGGKVLRLGRHKFSVNQQALDLSLVEHNKQLCTHISGTDFYQPIVDDAFLSLQQIARLDVSSESESVYRGEYLAYLMLNSAINKQDDLSLERLYRANREKQLLSQVQSFAAPRYKEGYVKGIHDHDAALILQRVLPTFEQAGLLRFSQAARAHALLWLMAQTQEVLDSWTQQAKNAQMLKEHLNSSQAFVQLQQALADTISGHAALESSEYLIRLLAVPDVQIDVSQDAFELCEDYLQYRRSLGWNGDDHPLNEAFADHQQWLAAYTEHKQYGQAFVVEAAAIAVCKTHSQRLLSSVDFSLACSVDGLLGEHERVKEGKLTLVLDDFIQRGEHHRSVVVPQFDAYLSQRTALLNQAKDQFRLSEFKPRPLTSFVRNKLISDSYLHLIGDNFAKQMGTVGDKKRTDLMGMLLLISPPGYGKTTLIEYVAHKLGLVFMKINGPSIGHQVTSLDPADAPDQNSAREIEKINLAFEMGNNVLLYLDDIQHTNPELLQKFISLCDGTRRIEGTWQGKTKTYDMRGKKFAVVMAGNPYTESGEAFRIPDMLANRADIYNLGDMLSDQQYAFELSFIENSLTSNPVLAPLATRDLNDLYRFVQMAQGEGIALSDMSYSYSSTEANEIVATLQKLMQVQQTVLKVNQQYILSAATADEYRVEPPFKLQGSYRNMNKLAEKISSVMTEEELNTLLQDHYQGEAQTLANGTEENLLKLAELRGNLTQEQQARWQEIKLAYQRKQMMGDDSDRAGQVVQQLAMLNQHVARFAQPKQREKTQ
ncbi:MULTISPECIES: DNA repair ATPase [unclassified Vibrio]|uniref:DNA repair ATPase n=1 Tax=unclassified Vibrio TaxID=2614977 RepID=UPI00136180B8|nr:MULTISPECIES: DNA repair ATPase [unclassified Vibrio]NAW55920.1 AAA domain-containing protein [Vibrio sp. V36_P2S2PM302]NAX24234.1 AAA domain-containing protein [Vibrio sp. V38_P2S17PM301]NAX28633.1 AAA domain-containing protein [Vibrio sp. V37_P2S8PM304]